MSARQWTPEQQQALTEYRAELVVSAAAGSGKTAVLVERAKRLALGVTPLGPVSLERMLVITFTRLAAAELKARLHSELLAALHDDSERKIAPRWVLTQLAALPRAQISTIHSFCADVIRRYGYLRGISLGRILDEEEAALTEHELATRFLDERLGAGAEDDWALALAWGGHDGVGSEDVSQQRWASGLRAIVLRLRQFSCSLTDPQAWYDTHVDLPPLDEGRFDAEHPALAALAVEFGQWRVEAMMKQRRFAAELSLEYPAAVLPALIDRRLALLGQLDLSQGWQATGEQLARFGAKQEDIKYNPQLMQPYRRDIPKDSPWYERIGAQGKQLQKELAGWRELFAMPWAEVATRENRTRQWLKTLWRLAQDFDAHYRAYKRERGLMDYADLERQAYRVLAVGQPDSFVARDADGHALPSEAALELRRRFVQVLVDEHQDTSELQDAIVNLAVADAPAGDTAGRPRFVVGDLKQSIYAFRLATPELFSAARKRTTTLADDIGQAIKLIVNFRSRPRLLSAVNHLFSGLLTEALGGEDYTQNRLRPGLDYAELFSVHDAEPQVDRAVRLHLVPQAGEPDADGEREAEDGAEEPPQKQEAVYRAVAQLLWQLKVEGGDGYKVYDPERKVVVPLSWRHMVVLLRSRTHLETLLAVLAQAGVPAYSTGRTGFYERPEVSDVLALLSVVDNPRDDVALATVLSSVAVGLSPVALLQVARANGAEPGADLYTRLRQYQDAGGDAGLREGLGAFIDRLQAWRSAARREPLPEFLWRLYRETGILTAVAGLKSGGQRVANLMLLHERARQFAGFERQGLARFLSFLAQQRRAAGDLGEAPVLTEAQDVVRVLTIHQAKGLEFPVVVLPDLHREFNTRDLAGDVLWHRRAGLGGRFVDLRASPPVREKTLSWRGVAQAKHRDLLSEELRILYVALTRARERLELVSAVDETKAGQADDVSPPEQAKCTLDWLRWRLGDSIAAALAEGTASTGADGCWEILRADPQALERRQLDALQQPEPLTEAEAQMLRSRLSLNYVFSGAAQLPVKLTVTRLAHETPLPIDADDEWTLPEGTGDGTGVAEVEVPQPEFMTGRREPSAAEIGTATHQQLAAVDYRAHHDVGAVEALRDELIGRGVLDAAAAKQVDCAAVAQAVSELAQYVTASGAQAYREQPVAQLIPARDAKLLSALSLSIEPASLAPDDAVYVQGVIDLLVVGEGEALVLDFKTDRGVDADALAARYRAQLSWYCRAVAALLPGHTVRWALYGLAGPGLVGPFAYE